MSSAYGYVSLALVKHSNEGGPIDWARGGSGDHFGLFSVSVRGQVAELEPSAGQLASLLQSTSL